MSHVVKKSRKTLPLKAYLMRIWFDETQSKTADGNLRRNVFFVNLGTEGVGYIDSAAIPPA